MSSRRATNRLTAGASMGALVKMPSELNVIILISGCERAMPERSRKTARHGWECHGTGSLVSRRQLSRVCPILHSPCTTYCVSHPRRAARRSRSQYALRQTHEGRGRSQQACAAGLRECSTRCSTSPGRFKRALSEPNPVPRCTTCCGPRYQISSARKPLTMPRIQ